MISNDKMHTRDVGRVSRSDDIERELPGASDVASPYMADPSSVLRMLSDPSIKVLFPDRYDMSHDWMIGTAGSGQPLAKFTHDCRRPPITAVEAALRFYDDNYDMVANYFVAPGAKTFLDAARSGHCRFCGREEPNVTFRNDAHAIPECLGNRTLFTRFECDDCNQLFGQGIENDFGNWSLPMRTVSCIKGKKGYPTIKLDLAGRWRIQANAARALNITGDDNPSFTADEVNKQVHMKLPRGPYTPIAVAKALVRMGLTIMPDTEMADFKDALAWIRDSNHASEMLPVHPIFQTFVPGPLPNNFVALLAWRRKHDGLEVPYASFLLTYANEVIQVFLPSPVRNANVMGKSVRLYRFPHLLELGTEIYGPSMTQSRDMSGTTIVKGDMVEATTRFGHSIDRTSAS